MVNNLFILVYTMSATAMPQQGKIGEIEMEHRSQVTLSRYHVVQERQGCQTLCRLNVDVLSWVNRGLKIFSLFVDRKK